MRLILYSKPGCHLCEGLQEKLEHIQNLDLELEVRDITTRDDWFQAYQYEIPVLFWVREERESGVRSQKLKEDAEKKAAGSGQRAEGEMGEQGDKGTRGEEIQSSKFIPISRVSPRASVQQLERILRSYLEGDRE
ncbi:glutaredoxin family protein [Kovacikia minuta]|uniref:glutaredoxin family protein n=1 Tax=Kovacikia minuta TaxID=2931930 RepID=UPI002677147C